MKFGEDLRKCRKDINLSQKEVAQKLGIYQSSVSDWENDISRPDYETLFELCKMYNVTLYQLLGIDENTFRKI